MTKRTKRKFNLELEHSPARIVHAWLCFTGLISHPAESAACDKLAWPGFVNFMPESPDGLVVLTDTSGIYLGRSMRGRVFDKPSIQVRVRSAAIAEPEAWAKAAQIRKAFDRLVKPVRVIMQEDVTHTIQSISISTPVTALGRSRDTDRPNFSVNAFVVLADEC